MGVFNDRDNPSRQTWRERQDAFFATACYLCPLFGIHDDGTVLQPDEFVEDHVYSGWAADMVLRAMSFGAGHIEWSAKDEASISKIGRGKGWTIHSDVSGIIRDIGTLWKEKLKQRHVSFDFDLPITDTDEFYDSVEDIGRYIGADDDVTTLLRGVPIDDILA